jgi:hypothetical protein
VDGGELHWFLGFEIKRDWAARTISINQRNYIERMVDRFGLANAKPVATPMEPGTQFGKDQSSSTPTQEMCMCRILYVEAIGKV